MEGNENTIGNNPQNCINGARIALQNEYLYFVGNDGLYDIDTSGKNDLNKIVNGDIYSINILGDWVYYTDSEQNLYKIKAGGEKKVKLLSNCEKPFITLNSIYYEAGTQSDYFGIRKSSTDGTNDVPLIDNGFHFSVYEQYIYYLYWDEYKYEDMLYRCELDGKNNELIKENVNNYIVIGENIYYVCVDDYSVKCLNINSGDEDILYELEYLDNEYGILVFIFDNSYLYFTCPETKGVYQMSLDGKEVELLYPKMVINENVYVFNDRIYVLCNNNLYRIYSDGRTAKKLS